MTQTVQQATGATVYYHTDVPLGSTSRPHLILWLTGGGIALGITALVIGILSLPGLQAISIPGHGSYYLLGAGGLVALASALSFSGFAGSYYTGSKPMRQYLEIRTEVDWWVDQFNALKIDDSNPFRWTSFKSETFLIYGVLQRSKTLFGGESLEIHLFTDQAKNLEYRQRIGLQYTFYQNLKT